MDIQIIDLGPFDEVVEIHTKPRKGEFVSRFTFIRDYDGSILPSDYFHFFKVAPPLPGGSLWRIAQASTTTLQIGGESFVVPITEHKGISSVMPGGEWFILPGGMMLAGEKIGSMGRIARELYGVGLKPAGSALTSPLFGVSWYIYLGHSALPHPKNGAVVTYRVI
ncbi:MAG: hypothetical protein HQL51_03905 [Magnetococcales bacterium]|nr:hypothetical protein [Magnetococcales bacterium]